MSSGTSIDAPLTFKSDTGGGGGGHPPRNHNNRTNHLRFNLSGSEIRNHKNTHQRRYSQRQQQEIFHSGSGGHKRRFPGNGNPGNGPNWQDSKFKKRRRNGLFVPPTKFLLGGNINDPLNLSSLEDEEVNKKMNEVTPYSSPVPPLRHHEQIEVLIPQNINDPLNLNSGEDIEFKLVSPKAKKRRKHKLKKKNNELNDEAATVATETPAATVTAETVTEVKKEVEKPMALKPTVIHHQAQFKGNNGDRAMDKIVSPVVPQGSPLKFHRRYRSWSFSNDDAKTSKTSKNNKKSKQNKVNEPNFRKKDEQFQYGNYNRYYGYRYGAEEDPRLVNLKREWFESKSVLDIGCNVGFLTLQIARDLKPSKIIGMDIDEKLVRVARKNVAHYLLPPEGGGGGRKSLDFPISMAICHGPLVAAAVVKKEGDEAQFPNNVFFINGNYVPESDELLEIQKPEFDTILCLSLTKWIHFNFGDDGLKRSFKRMYSQLRPGGRLILEAQPWSSYTKKKKLTETIYKNYNSIDFRPAQFNEYLLSSEVGFSTCELIDLPNHPSKGFCRPMYLFTKSDTGVASDCDKV